MLRAAWKPLVRHANAAWEATFPASRRNLAARRALGSGLRLCRHHQGYPMLASRNLLAVLVLVLVAALAVTGYALYQEKKQPDGVEISVGKNGLSIKEK
jgi:hypothetical protein